MREGAGGGSGPREALLLGTGMSVVPVSFTKSQNLRVSWPGSAPRAGGDDIHSNPLPGRGAAWRSGMRPAHLLARPPNAAPPLALPFLCLTHGCPGLERPIPS